MSKCPYCLNAVNSDLNSDNDLSYMSVGKCSKGYSLHLRTGNKWPTALVFSTYDSKVCRNVDVAVYVMKFCPECGRKLIENGGESDE